SIFTNDKPSNVIIPCAHALCSNLIMTTYHQGTEIHGVIKRFEIYLKFFTINRIVRLICQHNLHLQDYYKAAIS
ncbi:MAG: hypothetical protein ABUL58_07735, partial [Steroidobacter sp.]